MLSANWFLGEEKFQLNTVSDNISFVLICFIGNLAMRVQIWASLVTQLVKNLPAMQETWVRSLGWEDPLKKGMAVTHSSILAWKIPRTV